MNNEVYILALGANLCFALGSQVFTLFSRRISSTWMNFIKATVALVAFGLTVTLLGTWHVIEVNYFLLFLFSGIIGLGMGDILLLKSFSEMGPGRTLIIFSFQPLILGAGGYFLFNQTIDTQKFWAILFFICCVVIFSIESFRRDRNWQIKGILMAIGGMTLDATGLLITRYSFDHNPELSSLEGNFYRCIGAIILFLIISKIRPVKIYDNFVKLVYRDKLLVIGGSLLGTFLSLSLYLKALQSAHLASLSGIAITGTIFSAIFEGIIEKRWPSKYLIAAFIFFLIGMKIIML
ncbi:MAG: DMT family transporter [Halobacteriovoraceae bacterium]|nr:DMT family transporter [Halobacteriovoraceae bacterium]